DLIALDELRPYVIIGNGDGTFQNPVALVGLPDGKGASILSYVDAGPIDVDGDGKLDIVGLGRTINGSVIAVFTGDGNGVFNATGSYLISNMAPSLLALGDVNKDGYGDALVMDQAGMLYPAMSVKGLNAWVERP